MMTARNAGYRVGRKPICHEHVFPTPFASRVRILHRQRIRQPHICHVATRILVENGASPRKMRPHRRQQNLGKDGHAVLAALAIAHPQLTPITIDILDAPAHGPHTPHSPAVPPITPPPPTPPPSPHRNRPP